MKALEEPVKQIAINAGLEGAVIVDKVKAAKPGIGYDVLSEKCVDMIASGIVQNAASVASILLTTEAVVADIPEPEPAAPAGGGMGGMY